jgi:hypothetical protein
MAHHPGNGGMIGDDLRATKARRLTFLAKPTNSRAELHTHAEMRPRLPGTQRSFPPSDTGPIGNARIRLARKVR